MEHIANNASSPAETDEFAAGPPSSPEADNTISQLAFEPVELAFRTGGWTPERQRAFIEELADCGIVREAAARVGMTEQSAFRLRRRSDAAAFNMAWDSAVRIGVERIHSIAFERAITGTMKRRYYHGQVVGEERVFDNRLLIHLLSRTSLRSESNGAAYRIDQWDQWMSAVEDGLARPAPKPDETSQAPVWRDEDGVWMTKFPPPDGFTDQQWGCYGEEDYCRPLNPEEAGAIEAWEARELVEGRRQRERYFARLR